MKYRKFGKTGKNLSLIGFGCMRLPTDNHLAIPLIQRAVELGINYFETAILYCQNRSEVQLGLSLKENRDKVYISTKSSVFRKGERRFNETMDKDTTGEDFKNNLEESLWKLGTDRVDFYQFHNLSLEKLPIAMAEGGPLDVLKEAKDKGMIDHIGFTSHDKPANLIKILDTGEFESMTVYHNLLQTRGTIENPLVAIDHARKMGIGVIIMGPLGGGILGTTIDKISDLIPDNQSQVELAFRYLLSIPGVNTPISGMTKMEDLENNSRIASQFEPLSTKQMTRIKEVIGKYSSLMEKFCSGCGYCQPCLQGVRIPEIFRFVNYYNVYELKEWAKQQYKNIRSGQFRGSAELCRECGECEKKCPQKIIIREELKKAHKLLIDDK